MAINRVTCVYCIVNKNDGTIVRGTRSGDSPFYALKLNALKKCLDMNEELLSQGKDYLYQVEEFQLVSSGKFDVYDTYDEACVNLRENHLEYYREKYDGYRRYQNWF